MIIHRPKIGLIIFLVMLGFFVSFMPTQAQAADYCVADPKGVDGIAGTADDINSSDNYAGTEAQPFATLRKGAAVAIAGDTVFIRGGIYVECLSPRNSGIAGNPITFQSYPGETVTLYHGSPTLDDFVAPNDDYPDHYGDVLGVYIYGKSYITIKGLTITHVGGWARVVNSDHIIIRDCNCSDAYYTGYSASIGLYDSDYNTIYGNTLTDGTDNITLIKSDHNLVENNHVTEGAHSLFGIRAGNFNVIRGNYFYNSLEKIGEIFDLHLWPYDSQYDCTKHNLVENNTFAYTLPGGAYEGIQYAGQNGIIRNNVLYDCQGTGITMAIYGTEAQYNLQNRVYNNVFYNNTGGGILTGDSSDSSHFSNNIFKNNIFYRNKPMPIAWADNYASGTQITNKDMANFMFDNNNIINETPGENDVIWDYSNHRISLSTAQINYPLLYVNNTEVNPGFVDAENYNFHLNSSSQMIDNGIFLTNTSGARTNSNILQVEDAGYFSDGFEIEGEVGDLIQLEGRTETARITNIDYVNNTLTLDQPLSWTSGQGVTLRYSGAKPDIGAYEYVPSDVLIPGDVNGDKAVNSMDVQACVNHILGNQDWTSTADVNKDSAINALDIQAIVNIILGV